MTRAKENGTGLGGGYSANSAEEKWRRTSRGESAREGGKKMADRNHILP